jgi:hypothetical protein
MVPAKKSEPAAAVGPARRPSNSRVQAPSAVPPAKVIATPKKSAVVKRGARNALKIPAASAETTVKRAVGEATGRKVAKKRGAV